MIAAGGEKAKAHITFPNRGFIRQLRELEDAGDLPQNVVVNSSQTGWIREETIQNWIEEVLLTYTRENGIEQFLLIVDRYRVHLMENFGYSVTEMGGILNFVPPGCTSLAQPLDIAVMRSFKVKVRNRWKNWKN